MRPRPANKVSAQDLLAELSTKDKSEAKHQSLFFVPPAKTEPKMPEKIKSDPLARAPLNEQVSAIKQPLAVAPPTDEELGITWVDRLKKLMETRSAVLVIDLGGGEKKLIPMDDAGFTLAAKALETRPVK